MSTILVHSITLPVHQPFGTVMEKSGVETRSSEHTMLSDEAHVLLVTDSCYSEQTRSSEETMLSDEAHVLLVTDSSSEEYSETDDQSYSAPPRCML